MRDCQLKGPDRDYLNFPSHDPACGAYLNGKNGGISMSYLFASSFVFIFETTFLNILIIFRCSQTCAVGRVLIIPEKRSDGYLGSGNLWALLGTTNKYGFAFFGGKKLPVGGRHKPGTAAAKRVLMRKICSNRNGFLWKQGILSQVSTKKQLKPPFVCEIRSFVRFRINDWCFCSGEERGE